MPWRRSSGPKDTILIGDEIFYYYKSYDDKEAAKKQAATLRELGYKVRVKPWITTLESKYVVYTLPEFWGDWN